MATLTGVRLQRFNALPAFRNDQGGDADRRYQIMLLQRQQRVADKSNAKREELRVAREALERIHARELKKQADIEAKRLRDIRIERDLALARAKREEINRKARERRDKKIVAFDIYTKPYENKNEGHDDEANYDVDTNAIIPVFINACQKLIGKKTVYLQHTYVNEISSNLIEIKGGDAEAIFWNSISPHIWYRGSDAGIKRGHYVCLLISKIPSKAIIQSFRDGEKHCVIEPLVNLWQSMADRSESDASKKRCAQIANKIRKLEGKYVLGVPEKDMEEVAQIAQRCLIIHDIIGNEIIKYNSKSTKNFHFTNTRANHLNTGHIAIDKQYISVSQSELNDLIAQHDQDDEFFLFCGDLSKNCRSIRSARGAWAVYNPDHEIFKDFSTNHNINNYGINAIKYPELNEFVKEARIINSAPTPLCDKPNDLEGAKHVDVEKAYTQHKYAPFYKGFLGHIQQWRKLDARNSDFIVSHIGIYQFRVLTNTSLLLKKLGMRVGYDYTLPSPEIEYFMSLGMEIELIAGCWGSTFDIEYTPEMLSNRRYCTWAGKLGMDKAENIYTFKGDKKWASHLKSELGDDNVLFFSGQNIIVVKIPKNSYYTTHHILAFITSYTRMNMIHMMSSVKGELIKAVLDGLYYRGELPAIEIPCKSKEVKEHIGFRSAWYYPSEIDCSTWPMYDARFDGSCVLAGAGGTGKSYSVLTDKGIINPLYVVPSHVLGRSVRTNYKCNYTTIHKLIGEECRPFKESHYEPGVAFLDELTMIEADWVKRMIAMYPNTLFFIAGDIDEKQWFQCRNGAPGKFSSIWIDPTWRFVHYTTDMRSQDEELRTFKADIRSEMRRVFSDGGDIDSKRMSHYVQDKAIDFFDAVQMFVPGDAWIAGTHDTNKKLLAMGVVSGFINTDKEIVYSGEGEKRGSFTTHSFQGLTIKDKRVFISLDFFEYAMLYTSISRVCKMDQIVLVRG